MLVPVSLMASNNICSCLASVAYLGLHFLHCMGGGGAVERVVVGGASEGVDMGTGKWFELRRR